MAPSLRDHPFRIYYGPADNPLEDFYIPALSASVRYDRSAGFFSSSALAVAAEGVAHLIRNGGQMRLLVGASLIQEDVEAIQRGYDLQATITERLLERFPDPQDALQKERLQVLAWMVAAGTLEIRVVLRLDADGLPIPAYLSHDYYHPKTGVFTDANGDRVAFTGSINESETAWKHNYEEFSVYTSWGEGRSHLPHVHRRFVRMWEGKDPEWLPLRMPEAVEKQLLKYRPHEAPVRDPLEIGPAETVIVEPVRPYIAGSPQAERLLFQFLRDAPYLPSASELGAATSAVTPWPHQSRIAGRILDRFPERAMLCDEVGLGKTIEAGLVLRQLLLSGWVKRCLILVPKSVLKQWQEELYEKFALEVPRYDQRQLWDVHGIALPIDASDPWDACDVLLVSSQLAKRTDRRQEILSARGWDLLVVDEAHHARRKDFKQRIYRPNQLLGLLNDFKAQGKHLGLLMMTATPMQIHPLEVWDLLSVIGVGGRWGAFEDNFLNFFSEMRKPFGQIEWEFVYDMVRDYLETGGEIEEVFRDQVLHEIGPVQWATLAELPYRPGRRKGTIKRLGQRAEPHVKEMARRHTPLNHYVFRSTRELLREYERRGILRGQVPTRKPRMERVQMRSEEQALYQRIDEYISHFYHKYENERRGLGFVMTVYRRRLTSSFFALRCSLERRLEYLKGRLDPDDLFDNDDMEQDVLSLDIDEQVLDDVSRDLFQAEQDYVEGFIQELRLLSVSDSKLEVLKEEINRIFKRRSTILVFTQYTDTMDYLRGQLREVYSGQVACYSGRGGEIWNGIAWVRTTKEWVKNEFREGNIRILLGTESASEGLNLQTCGVLINYDMPWNPMRVEQRIGRIDRIGQKHQVVWISNYIYKDTIEDQVYQRLADRINWFEVVVGNLQPILAEVSALTRRLAMLPPSERNEHVEREIEALRQRMQDREVEALNLDDYVEEESYEPGPPSPVTLEQIEHLLVNSQTTGHLFHPDPELRGAYLLSRNDEPLKVTFAPKVFDAHPDTVRFLTYGSSLFAELLADIPGPQPGNAENGSLVRCRIDGDIDLRGWYAPATSDGLAARMATFADVEDWIKQGASTPAGPQVTDQAKVLTQDDYWAIRGRQAEIINHRRTAEFLTQKVRAQRLLLQAAMVEIALGRAPDMFDMEAYPSAFNEQAVLGLQRHRFPWTALLKLAYEDGLAPQEHDAYFERIASDDRESLRGRFAQLSKGARRSVGVLSAARKALDRREPPEAAEVEVQVY